MTENLYKRVSHHIKIIQNEYITKKGRDIQIEELAKLLKVSKEDIVIAMDSNNRHCLVVNAGC